MAGILPLVEAHSPIPIMGLCKLRACSHAFLETLGDLKARWQELRRDTLRRLRRALNGCLLPPRFQKRSIPRASWDLAFCREIENVHFPPSPFYGPGCSGGRQLSGTWRRRNPAEEAVVGWMQARLVRERHYSSLQMGVSSGWIARSARVVQLLLGPACLYLSFEETAVLPDVGASPFTGVMLFTLAVKLLKPEQGKKIGGGIMGSPCLLRPMRPCCDR